MLVLTLAMSEADRDSVGTTCGRAGADASSAVCSELRAETSAYLPTGCQKFSHDENGVGLEEIYDAMDRGEVG